MLHDYRCPICDVVEERYVSLDTKDEQVCNNPMHDEADCIIMDRLPHFHTLQVNVPYWMKADFVKQDIPDSQIREWQDDGAVLRSKL
jgi:hypothetical protein